MTMFGMLLLDNKLASKHNTLIFHPKQKVLSNDVHSILLSHITRLSGIIFFFHIVIDFTLFFL